MLPSYEEIAIRQMQIWQSKMLNPPTFLNRVAKKMQVKINNIIPEKIHQIITATIKQMIRAVLFGSELTTRKPLLQVPLQTAEALVLERLEFYKKAAAAEGGITGAGGNSAAKFICAW